MRFRSLFLVKNKKLGGNYMKYWIREMKLVIINEKTYRKGFKLCNR